VSFHGFLVNFSRQTHNEATSGTAPSKAKVAAAEPRGIEWRPVILLGGSLSNKHVGFVWKRGMPSNVHLWWYYYYFIIIYIYVYMFDIETNINPFVGEAGGTKFALDEDSFPRGLNFRRCCKMDRWILQGNMRLTWAIFSTHILLNIVGLTNRIGSSIHWLCIDLEYALSLDIYIYTYILLSIVLLLLPTCIIASLYIARFLLCILYACDIRIWYVYVLFIDMQSIHNQHDWMGLVSKDNDAYRATRPTKQE
jgi:hypothetical protein